MASIRHSTISLLRSLSPALQTSKPIRTIPVAPSQITPACRQFTTTPQLQKDNKGGAKRDARITSIRYFLHHPRTPRPLRFSRTRYLRHWTIHRAWHRYQDVLREKRERELERQYNAMAAACEHLRLMDANGLTDQDRRNIAALSQPPREEGRLYRIAMLKNGIWKGVPIEYARMQTETPARDGWNHSWTR